MAKAKRTVLDDEIIDGSDLAENLDEFAPAEETEAERLRKEIAALRAENESLRVQTSAPKTEDSAPDQRWLVSLQDGVSWVVEAPNEADAVRAYKQQVGMISTSSEITASKANDLPLGRYNTR